MLTYPKNYQEAVAWQEARRGEVRVEPLPRQPRLVGGSDASYSRAEKRIFGAVAVFTYPGLDLVEETALDGPCPFPYIPGLLSFREAPIIVEIWKKLTHRPDVLLVDGRVSPTPGVWALPPTWGCCWIFLPSGWPKAGWWGKGTHRGGRPGRPHRFPGRGGWWGGFSGPGPAVQPLFVSPGHRVDFTDSREITLGCVRGYRLPEPVRRADMLSRRWRAAVQTGKGEE